MKYSHKLSIAIPIHDMKNAAFFLERLMGSIKKQSFTDYQIVITKDGKMAENTNAAMRKCTGEIIKIIYMDDYFTSPDSLKEIVDAFDDKTEWLATGCAHDFGGQIGNPHYAVFNPNIRLENTIGSPSVIALRNRDLIFFDEKLSWMLDAEYYDRMSIHYGPPKILDSLNVTLGVGDHQMTSLLTNEEKLQEVNYVLNL